MSATWSHVVIPLLEQRAAKVAEWRKEYSAIVQRNAVGNDEDAARLDVLMAALGINDEQFQKDVGSSS